MVFDPGGVLAEQITLYQFLHGRTDGLRATLDWRTDRIGTKVRIGTYYKIGEVGSIVNRIFASDATKGTPLFEGIIA